MNKLRLQTPDGFYDYLPNECGFNNKIIDQIEHEFTLWGYRQVETPCVEYNAVFAQSNETINDDRVIKFMDYNGRLLALCPDVTLPVARLVSTKMQDFTYPVRLFYNANVFYHDTKDASPARQSRQMGVEMIGSSSTSADAEIIALAVKGLLATGLENFQIEIGQAAFFKGIMAEAGLDDAEIEKLREMVSQKNMLGLEILLKEQPLEQELRNNIMHLPYLFGDVSVLDTALEMCQNPISVAAIQNLREVYNTLADYGLCDYISFDLGMVHGYEYYTGIFFRGIASGLGAPIVKGGRYDNLLASFGSDRPATGFAIETDGLFTALRRQGCTVQLQKVDVILGYTEAKRAEAFSQATTYRNSGKSVIMLPSIDNDFLNSQVQDLGATEIIIIK